MILSPYFEKAPLCPPRLGENFVREKEGTASPLSHFSSTSGRL